MADITPLIQQYTVDFASNNNFLFVKAVQGDGHQTRYADILLMNNGMGYEVDSSSVRAVIRGTKPDGTSVFNECEIIDDCTVRVEITQQIAACVGKGDYEISIMSLTHNKTLTSFPFHIIVSPTSFDVNSVTSSDEFLLLVDKINQVDKSNQEADALIEEQKVLKGELETALSDSIDATEESRQATQENKEATQALVEFHEEVKTAENIRVDSENQRIENESKRITDENQRNVDEANRQANEGIRESNEIQRINDENARLLAEATRESNEQTRIENENVRVENENARIQQAESFANEEALRIENENQRIEDENIRIENEKARIAQATTFAESEEIRILNEEQRIANEELRQQQEAERQANTSTAIANAEAATDSALGAVQNIQHGIGINDSPTEGEAATVAYSAQKIEELIKELKKSGLSLIVDTDGTRYKFGKDEEGIYIIETDPDAEI